VFVLLSLSAASSISSSTSVTTSTNPDIIVLLGLVAAILTALFLGPTFAREILRIVIRPNLQIDGTISVEKEGRYMKYPGHLEEQTNKNLAYCKTTIRNVPPSGRLKRIKGRGRGTAHVAITLRASREGSQPQEFRLLWLIPGNPITATLAKGDELPVVFLTVDLEGHEIIVPTDSLGESGRWSGSLLIPGYYNLELKYSGGEWVALGQRHLPQDMLERAVESEIVRYAQENGGYCVYFEKIEQGVSIRCEGAIGEERLAELHAKYRPTQILLNGKAWQPPRRSPPSTAPYYP
jgi:hypothetical protein